MSKVKFGKTTTGTLSTGIPAAIQSHTSARLRSIHRGEQNTPTTESLAVGGTEAIATVAEYRHDAETLKPTALQRKYKPTYYSWHNMKYGRGKNGAVIAPEFAKFADFLRHMGPRPTKEFTCDRIDNDNPTYGPGLCRWADKKTQARNRSTSHFLTDPRTGEKLPLMDWAQRLGMKPDTMRAHKRHGWTDAEVLQGFKHTEVTGQPASAWLYYITRAKQRELREFSPLEYLPLDREACGSLQQQYNPHFRRNGCSRPEHIVEFVERYLSERESYWREQLDEARMEVSNTPEDCVNDEMTSNLEYVTFTYNRASAAAIVARQIQIAWSQRLSSTAL